jgi:hypothetical protein
MTIVMDSAALAVLLLTAGSGLAFLSGGWLCAGVDWVKRRLGRDA